MFEYSTEKQGECTVIHMAGGLDAIAVAEFERQVMGLVESGTSKIVLDMKELQYISSAGLHIVLRLMQKVKAANGWLGLCSLSTMVEEVISLVGFRRIIPVFENLDNALQACNAKK